MLQITATQVFGFFGGLSTVGLGIVGYLILRAVRSVDDSVAKLGSKVDSLSKTDTAIRVQVAALRARVVALEFHIHRGHPPPMTDEELDG